MRASLALAAVAGLGASSGLEAAGGAARSSLSAARAPAAELRLERKITLPGGATVRRYSQAVGGIPVLGAEVVALGSDSARTRAQLFADDSRGAIEPPPEPRLTAAEAIGAALGAAGVWRRRGEPSTSLAIDPGDGGTLVWRVRAPSARPLADFEVLVDARTGEVRAIADRLWHATGEARLFLPNPVVDQGNENWAHLRDDRDDRNTKRLTSLRTQVTLKRLKTEKGCLRGKYALALFGSNGRSVCRSSRRWNGIRRSNNRFEALMSYHWIDQTQAYIQELGFSDTTGNGANDRRQLVVANAFGRDNSYFSPFGHRIALGEGGVDDGEDADVIIHEYGHAVQEDQRPRFGGSTAAGAMGEGFGDYLSATVTTETAGASEFFATCIFDWDGISYTSGPPHCGRTAETEDTKTERLELCGHQIHCLGEVWSSALWDLREALGPDLDGYPVIDRILLASHFLVPADVSFEEAAHALLAADDALYPDGSPGDETGLHRDAIEGEMTFREFCPVSGC